MHPLILILCATGLSGIGFFLLVMAVTLFLHAMDIIK